MNLALRRCWLILGLLLVLPCVAMAGEPVEITILHVNDTHGHILPAIEKTIDETIPVSGAAHLAVLVAAERAKNPQGTLLLSAGDMFQGTPISNVFRGAPGIAVMNALHFDAMAIGNHEFDWSLDTLRELRTSASFPFLSANIEKETGGPIEGVKPFVILDRKGLKIAVIGLTTEEVAYTTKPDYVKSLRVLEPEKVLPGLIADAKRQGAQLIIVLSHIGLDADKAIARAVPGIDLIVGGHSHTAVTAPVLVGATMIVQAGCYGYYLGVASLRVVVEDSGQLRVSGTGRLQTVLSGPDNGSDPRIAGLVNEYNEKIKVKFSEVVGETTVDLTTSKEHETNIGNLLTDAMRLASGADMAFQNSGGIRTNIPSGKISLEQAYTLLPFDNVLMTMDLPGTAVLRLLEQSAVSERGVLQMSGVTVSYDPSKPAGGRVAAASVGGRPLEPARTYRIATNDFLAAGGDDFKPFMDGKNVVYGDNLRDVFVTYLKQHSPVAPRAEGRVSAP
jgi:5'-nucleotidase / UDP-sugar diphosphatase